MSGQAERIKSTLREGSHGSHGKARGILKWTRDRRSLGEDFIVLWQIRKCTATTYLRYLT